MQWVGVFRWYFGGRSGWDKEELLEGVEEEEESSESEDSFFGVHQDPKFGFLALRVSPPGYPKPVTGCAIPLARIELRPTGGGPPACNYNLQAGYSASRLMTRRRSQRFWNLDVRCLERRLLCVVLQRNVDRKHQPVAQRSGAGQVKLVMPLHDFEKAGRLAGSLV